MTNMINKPLEVVFRQTLNDTFKRWNVPKRLVSVGRKDVWRSIDNVRQIITARDGLNNGIWRLQKIIKKIRDKDGVLVWKTDIPTKKQMVINKITYSVWTLTCTRIKRDLSGAA